VRRTYDIYGYSTYIWLPVDTVSSLLWFSSISRLPSRARARARAQSHASPHASHAEPHSARTCPPNPEGASARAMRRADCESTFKPRREGPKRRPRIDPSPSPTPWRQRVREEQPQADDSLLSTQQQFKSTRGPRQTWRWISQPPIRS